MGRMSFTIYAFKCGQHLKINTYLYISTFSTYNFSLTSIVMSNLFFSEVKPFDRISAILAEADKEKQVFRIRIRKRFVSWIRIRIQLNEN
jgi:hypothetical protein